MTVRSVTAGPVPVRLGPREPIRWEFAARPDGGTRGLIRLGPSDEQAFGRAVARLVPWIERGRGPWTFAHGSQVVERQQVTLTPWVSARGRWRRAVEGHCSEARAVAVTDVRDCYGSIRPSTVAARLTALGAPAGPIRSVTTWLRAFEDEGVRGLPVGPPASAVLAEAVMAAGDLALRASSIRHTRWVDDVAIFCDDRRTAVTALDELRRVWTSLGLEPHDGKTTLLDRDAAAVLLAVTSPSGACALR